MDEPGLYRELRRRHLLPLAPQQRHLRHRRGGHRYAHSGRGRVLPGHVQVQGREEVFLAVIGGMLVPATALALPLFLLFARVNLVGSYWSVLLPSIMIAGPFSLFLCRVSAEASVPPELVEAGRIDGAGEARIFFSIAARLMFPGLVTAFLAAFVVIWNNYLLPLVMLTNKDMYPITVGLGTWQGQTTHTDILETLILVGALISVVPLVIAFLFLQRFWRTGLALGGIKG